MSNFQRVNFSNQSSKVIGIKPINNEKLVSDNVQQMEESIEEKLKQAESILANAKQQSEELINQTETKIKADKENWQLEKEELAKQAYDQGYEEGFQLGKEESHQAYRQLVEQAKSIVDSAKKERQSMIDQSEEAVLHLSIKTAAKILHTELEQHDHYLTLVREVLADARDQGKIAIYSSPEDYQLVLTQKEELLHLVPEQTEVYFYPDAKLLTGACMIETPFGRIDAGVDSQLQEIKKKLLEVYQEQIDES